MFTNTRGMALLIVISLVLMLLILGGAVLVISTSHSTTGISQFRRVRAYYAAEAALQHVLWQLRTDPNSAPSLPASFNVNGFTRNSITISVANQPNPPGTEPVGVRPINVIVNY